MRAATRPAPISVKQTAQWLLDHGVGILDIATDDGLARKIADLFIWREKRLGAAPNDYEAVRTEFRRLAFEAERAGRSALCSRYAPAFMPTRVQ